MVSFPDLLLVQKGMLQSMATSGYFLRREEGVWYMVPISQVGDPECERYHVLDSGMIPELIELGFIRPVSETGETYAITGIGRFASRNRMARA